MRIIKKEKSKPVLISYYPSMKKTYLAGLLLYLSLLLNAQKAPMKFGNVSMDEVTMKYYEADSSVDAAVLCEYGVLDPNSGDFTWMSR